MQTLIGNRYRLLGKLGQGGFATVYRAQDTSLDREVAIKLLDIQLLQREDPTFLGRFKREAKTMASLKHPFIIDVYDYGEHDGQPYIVMPFLPGPSLDKLIKEKGQLEPAQALLIAEQVGQALDYAHENHIVHRDIKPANVLFDEYQQAILTDFGIVKLAGENTALTKTGTGMGTPFYMAPEQWKGKDIDARTDLYALGIMIYQLLTGRVPFAGDTAASIMYGHLAETPPAPQILNASLPPQVEPVLLKALAKDPAERYQTAGWLVEDLQAALAGKTIISVAPPKVAARPLFPRWVGPVIGALLVLGCGGLVAGLAFVGGSPLGVALFASSTPTATSTTTPTATSTATSTSSPTPTSTHTPLPTATATPTGTATPTATFTPAPATPTPGPTATPTLTLIPPTPTPDSWVLVADSSQEFRAPANAEGEWRYIWAESRNTFWWVPTAEGDNGCMSSGHINFDLAICKETIRNNSSGELAVQWKPLQDGSFRVEWDSPDLRFYQRDQRKSSQGPGRQFPYSVIMEEVVRAWDDFFWVTTVDTTYHIQIYRLQKQ